MFKRHRRRQYLILPRFQLRFILHQQLAALMAGGVFYGAIRYFFWKFQALGTAVNLPPDHIFFQFLNEQLSSMNLIFLISAFIMALVLSIYGLFISHRVAGPIYHLEKDLEALAKGEPFKELKFRKGDYFHSLAEKHNRAAKNLIERKGKRAA